MLKSSGPPTVTPSGPIVPSTTLPMHQLRLQGVKPCHHLTADILREEISRVVESVSDDLTLDLRASVLFALCPVWVMGGCRGLGGGGVLVTYSVPPTTHQPPTLHPCPLKVNVKITTAVAAVLTEYQQQFIVAAAL